MISVGTSWLCTNSRGNQGEKLDEESESSKRIKVLEAELANLEASIRDSVHAGLPKVAGFGWGGNRAEVERAVLQLVREGLAAAKDRQSSFERYPCWQSLPSPHAEFRFRDSCHSAVFPPRVANICFPLSFSLASPPTSRLSTPLPTAISRLSSSRAFLLLTDVFAPQFRPLAALSLFRILPRLQLSAATAPVETLSGSTSPTPTPTPGPAPAAVGKKGLV